jgi:hypothetical protein
MSKKNQVQNFNLDNAFRMALELLILNYGTSGNIRGNQMAISNKS